MRFPAPQLGRPGIQENVRGRNPIEDRDRAHRFKEELER